jgi:hypothetical protein
VTPENEQRGFDTCELGWVMWVENAPGFFLIEPCAVTHLLRDAGGDEWEFQSAPVAAKNGCSGSASVATRTYTGKAGVGTDLVQPAPPELPRMNLYASVLACQHNGMQL